MSKMRKLLVPIYWALLAVSAASLADAPLQPTAPDESKLIEHSHYINRDGQEVHSPAHSKTGSVAVGATAQCRDGTFSFSRHRSGTCSHHGGVSQRVN